ncbi:MAG: hypothetical protein HY321_21715 [Armatimonadetes bacterium]|nr:hypothetical protein [Armatimonadota bacterium]
MTRDGLLAAGRLARTACLTTLMACAITPAGADLSERLERGEAVTIVVLGDSLAAGWELPDPARDGYPGVFEAILQRRYPAARVRVISTGVPGDTARGGAARVESEVGARRPDAVVVQFGGNDHGARRSPAAFRRDLEMILGRIRERGAAVVLATPPIAEPEPETPMVAAVREVGRAQAVPVADFDAAIRRHGTGPRGAFPRGRHPGRHLHAVMARELDAAFARLSGPAPRLEVSIARGARQVVQGEAVPVTVNVRAEGAGPVAVCLECDGERREQSVATDRDGRASAVFGLPVTGRGRTESRRLLAWARRERAFGCDVGWLTFAPVVEAGGAGGALGQEGLVVGRERWGGAADLSGRFAVAAAGETLCLSVEVRDDRAPRRALRRASHESDCVEVFLDLRGPEDQGRPCWDAGVVGLMVHPGVKPGEAPSWRPLDGSPQGWQPLALRGALLPDGYRVEVDLPAAPFRERLAVAGDTIGFDIALDDADDDRGRKCQMVWAGGADDYIDPSLFGGLTLQPAPDGKPRVRVVVR